MEELLTVDELSKLLKFSTSTIYEWTHKDMIPYYKFGNAVRFKLSDVEKWLNKRRKSIKYFKKYCDI